MMPIQPQRIQQLERQVSILRHQAVRDQMPSIADADGQLADITTKFNTLLAYLKNIGIMSQ